MHTMGNLGLLGGARNFAAFNVLLVAVVVS